MRRHHFVVIGEVEARASVGDAAVAFDEFVEFAFRQVLRAFEHQVFEEVRESGAILWLNAEADVVINGYHHQRRCGVARQGDFEAVGEFVIGDGNGEAGRDGFSER